MLVAEVDRVAVVQGPERAAAAGRIVEERAEALAVVAGRIVGERAAAGRIVGERAAAGRIVGERAAAGRIAAVAVGTMAEQGWALMVVEQRRPVGIRLPEILIFNLFRINSRRLIKLTLC